MSLKIRWKLLLSYLLLSVLANLAVFFYLNSYLKYFLITSAESNLQRDLNVIKNYILLIDPYLSSGKAMEEIANRLGPQLGSRLTIINQYGIVLGDSGSTREDLRKMNNQAERVEVQQALTKGYGKLIKQTVGATEPLLYVAIPIAEGRGVVRLVRPLYEIEEASNLATKALLFGLPISIIISLILSFSVGETVAKNLRRMAKIVGQIAQGNYTGKFRYWGHDELGDLTGSLNALTEQLYTTMKRLTEERNQLKAILDSMSEGVLVLDHEGRILLINPSLLQILKLSEEEVIGRFLEEVIRHYELQEAFGTAAGKNESLTCEIHFASPGLDLTLLVHIQPIEKKEKQGGFVAVFYDVSTLKKLESVRRDFVANVSHELKTPLTTIKGYSETLLEGALEDSSVSRKFVETIYKHSERLARLIDDLLELSQIESQKREYRIEFLEFTDILSHALRAIDSLVQQKNLNVSKDITQNLPAMKADRLAIEQILFNLLDNAARYTPEKGSIRIQAKPEHQLVQIDITDTGIGIPEEQIPRIFERFYRVDPSRSRELGGTGLGLSIVKHLVSALGGTITVESKPGQGSTFSFTVPTI